MEVKIKKIKIGNANIKDAIVRIADKYTETLYPTNHYPLILGNDLIRELGNVQLNYKESILTIVSP